MYYKGIIRGQQFVTFCCIPHTEATSDSKLDNLEEMDKSLELYNLPRLNQEETENPNRPITSTEFQTVIQKLPPKNAQEQIASLVNSINIKHPKKI